MILVSENFAYGDGNAEQIEAMYWCVECGILAAVSPKGEHGDLRRLDTYTKKNTHVEWMIHNKESSNV